MSEVPETLDEELSIYVERMVRMLHLISIYGDVLASPGAVEPGETPMDKAGTMLAIVYSFYYSLIETDEQGVNFFRVWRLRAPTFAKELDTLERQIDPFREDLRLFRNRFGFHGSRSRGHEGKAFDLLIKHTPGSLWDAILATRNLSSRMIADIQQDSSSSSAAQAT